MTDRQAVMLALAALVGSLRPADTPLTIPAIIVATAFARRAPWLLVLGVALLCSSLAQRSWDGIDAERSPTIDGAATVVTDPERTGRGTSLVVRVDGTRYLATGWGAAGAQLGRTQAGEQVRLEGTVRPYTGSTERKAALHVGHRLSVATASHIGPGNVLWRLANGVRNHLVDGAASLSVEQTALFTGLVYGDDRAQDPVTASDFRLAGLTHLLAVSGQNVAYVLIMARPLIERCSLRGRWIATVGVLVVFATVTRFEASVLRATVMAGLAVTGRLLGREATTGRLLALAVTALLVVDPLLAHTVAFRLSVAASAGIVWLEPLVRPTRVRPKCLAETAGVTIAAQLAVAPVLVSVFGPVSLVALPANVLAGPVAGVTMAWGLSGAVVAGFLPAGAAAALHRVTIVLLWALETVARLAAHIPVAPVGLLWIGVAVAALMLRPVLRQTRLARPAVVALGAVLVLALIPRPEAGRHEVGRGSELWVHDDLTVLALTDVGSVAWLLDDLRAAQVRRIDLVVSAADHSSLIAELRRRIHIDTVRVLPQGETTLTSGSTNLVAVTRGAAVEVRRGS